MKILEKFQVKFKFKKENHILTAKEFVENAITTGHIVTSIPEVHNEPIYKVTNRPNLTAQEMAQKAIETGMISNTASYKYGFDKKAMRVRKKERKKANNWMKRL